MRLPRMDMIRTRNWRSLHLASLNLLAQTVAVAVPVTIKYMAARLRPPTQYLRTPHSLSCHDEAKIATRYFLYLSKYPRLIHRACRMGRQHRALRQVAYRSEVSNRSIPRANRRPHVLDDTQKQAQRGDKPIKIKLLPLHTARLQATIFCSPRRDKL